MGRYFEQTSVINYGWDQVVQAFWKRYPNPQSGHVLSEDTTRRHLAAGRLFSTRLLTKTNRLPLWGERLLSARSVPMQEDSVCDPAGRRLTTLTRNLAHSQLMAVTERVEYRPHPDLPQRTLVTRAVWVDSHVFGLGYAIQTLGIERFKKNIASTQMGFSHVLSQLFPQYSQQMTSEQPPLSAADSRKERIRETAKKATELAKSHAGHMLAACEEKDS